MTLHLGSHKRFIGTQTASFIILYKHMILRDVRSKALSQMKRNMKHNEDLLFFSIQKTGSYLKIDFQAQPLRNGKNDVWEIMKLSLLKELL